MPAPPNPFFNRFRSRFLRSLYPALGGRHLLLVLDEFEELQRHVVDTVLERITERGAAHFKYVWAGADGPERLTMRALAELLVHTDAATAAEIAALTQNRRQSCNADTALRALVRLESRDIVARTAPGSERFRFHVDLVRRWAAKNPQLIDTVNLVESAQ